MPCGRGHPGCFADYNNYALFPHDGSAKFQYIGRHGGLMGEKSNAGLCKSCGKCTKACPQHLPIPVLLKDVSREMDGMLTVLVPVMKGVLWCMKGLGKIKGAVKGRNADA